MYFPSLMKRVLRQRQSRSATRRHKAKFVAPASAHVEQIESRLVLTAAGHITSAAITSITSGAANANDVDGGVAEHVTVHAGDVVSVGFSYTIGTGANGSTNQHVEIWDAGFSTLLVTGVSNVVANEGAGTHTGSVDVSTAGLADGNYGVKLLITHAGNGVDSDSPPEGITIYSAVAAPVAVNTSTTVTAPDATYDGNAHGATATHAPAAATGTMTLHYTGTGDTAYDSSDAPTNAGTYHVVATFTPDDLVAYNASSDSADFTIAKADAAVAVSGYTGGTYDSNEHTQTVTVTGVGGGTLYTTSLSGTNAGSYSQGWAYSNPNYNDVSGTLAFTIAKATATVTVSNYSGTYDGLSHTASVTITGVGSDGTLTSSSVSRTGAGSDSTTASISGLQNYIDASGTATIDIGKATLSGFATTQSALNIAKMGSLTFNLNSITGLQNGETLATALAGVSVTLKMAKGGGGFNTYTFQPSVTVDTHGDTDASNDTVVVTYNMKAGTASAADLVADLVALDKADGVDSTSASNASVSAIWVDMSSNNYTFCDDATTKVF